VAEGPEKSEQKVSVTDGKILKNGQEEHSKRFLSQDGKYLICTVCKKKYNASGLGSNMAKKFFRKHMKTHGVLIKKDNEQITCQICKQVCRNRSMFRRHFIVHTRKKPFNCTLCTLGFEQKVSLERHAKVHVPRGEGHDCSKCDSSFKKLETLERHLKIVHRMSSQEFPKTPKTTDKTKIITQPKTESQTHNNAMQCNVEASRKQAISSITNSEKQCPKCQKAYKMIGRGNFYYKDHVRICNGYLEKSKKDAEEVQKPQLNVLSVENKEKSSCQICGDSFPKFSDLINHYTTSHYWTHLKEQYGTWGEICFICLLQFSTSDKLLCHVGNFHSAKSLDVYLVNDGYKVVTMEWTIKVFNTQCDICGKEGMSSSNMKAHFSLKHFSEQINREYPCSKGKKYRIKCPRCKVICENRTKRTSHLGMVHDVVVKYARKYLKVGSDDNNIIPVNGFEEKCVPTTSHGDATVQRMLEVMSTKVSKCLCPKCSSTFETRDVLKNHLATQHYFEKLAAVYPGVECKISPCTYFATTNTELIKHLAFSHEKVLRFLLEKDNLFLPPKTNVVSQSTVRIKKETLKEIYIKEELEDKKKSTECESSLEDNALDEIDPYVQNETKGKKHDIASEACSKKVPYEESIPITSTGDVPKYKECFLCHEDLTADSDDGILEHLCHHFQVELDEKYVKKDNPENTMFKCTKCGKEFVDKLDLLDHLGILHRCVKDFVPAQHWSSLFGARQIRVKAGAANSHQCPVQGCSRHLHTKELALIHMLNVHYMARIEREYEKEAAQENRVCPICNAKFHSNKVSLLKHIGVFHEKVMKYVEEDKEKDSINSLMTSDSEDRNYLQTTDKKSEVEESKAPGQLALFQVWEDFTELKEAKNETRNDDSVPKSENLPTLTENNKSSADKVLTMPSLPGAIQGVRSVFDSDSDSD